MNDEKILVFKLEAESMIAQALCEANQSWAKSEAKAEEIIKTLMEHAK